MEFIQYNVDHGIARITISRPSKLNALNQATVGELHQAFDQAAGDDQVAVVVVTGEGDKAFIAGADIAEIAAVDAPQAAQFSRAGQRLMQKIQFLGKPVIAAINGFALGGGCELALACHLRIAASHARLGQPEINLGLIPGFGGTQRLARLAGRAVANELCLLGGPIDAERAERLGLVNEVVEPAQLAERVTTVARQLVAAPRLAVSSILAAVERGADACLDTALDYETQLFAVCCASEDKVEGTRAFLEKRKPDFSR